VKGMILAFFFFSFFPGYICCRKKEKNILIKIFRTLKFLKIEN